MSGEAWLTGTSEPTADRISDRKHVDDSLARFEFPGLSKVLGQDDAFFTAVKLLHQRPSRSNREGSHRWYLESLGRGSKEAGVSDGRGTVAGGKCCQGVVGSTGPA